jgi:hypothetical protein
LNTLPARYLWLALVLMSSGGASCRFWSRPTDPLTPIAFQGPPTLPDVIYAVNANSDKVQQLATESATLSTAGAPSLRASLSLERPLRLRLRGRLIGQELDLGSNEELFWFWAKADPEHALYYAYHEQFRQDATNTVLPVGPDWLIEAIGLVNLDPSGFHEGPSERPDGGYEIRSRLERRGVQFTRVLIIDGKYGWIREQQVLDPSGRLLAVARNSNHRTYPAVGVHLPHRVQIELPPAQLAFQLEVGNYLVNQLAGEANQLFSVPHYEGYRLVNLAAPVEANAPVAAPASPPGSVYAPAAGVYPHTAYRLKYRGYGGSQDADPRR